MKTVFNGGLRTSRQVRWSAWNFQEILESRIPDYKGRPQRSEEEIEKIKQSLPKIVFQNSYEFDLLSKTRSNIAGEYVYQRDFRQKVAELFLHEAPHKLASVSVGDGESQKLAELRTLQQLSEYSGDLLESQLQNTQRLNDFIDSNPVYLLDQPLREEARWNTLQEMDNTTRAAVRTELRNWLPEDFRQVKAADVQQVAAFSPEIRGQMLKKIDERVAEAEKEIKSQNPSEQARLLSILKDDALASKKFVDPTFDITIDSIEKTTDTEELRTLAHRVADYNGDSRLIAILERASKITGDAKGAELTKQIKTILA
jgi:hypothetical protein